MTENERGQAPARDSHAGDGHHRHGHSADHHGSDPRDSHHHDSHHHGSDHRGSDHRGSDRLGLAAALNISFGVVQIVVGLAIGSVVVLADAAHQAVDALGLLTALVATRASRRPANEQWTYGLGKSDALGGFVSGLLLLGSVAWITVESIRRLIEPEPVSGAAVIIIGLIAIAVNGAGIALVGHDHGEDALSLRAARLHLITDLMGSFVVVLAGALLWLGGPTWIDPVASLAISFAVVVSTVRMMRQSTNVLLDRTPARITPRDVTELLEAQPDVERAHHVHVRSLGSGGVTVTAHVVVDGQRSIHESQRIVEELQRLLLHQRSVAHSTIQVECHPCD